MIELSFTKLLLVAVIALVVLGPEKLPKAARMAGAMLRRLRVGWDSVRSEVEHELQLEEIRRTARHAAERAESMRNATDAELRATHASVNAALADVTRTDVHEEPATVAKESDHGNA